MENSIPKIPQRTIGIDLGDEYSHFCVLDKSGSIVEEGRVATTKASFQSKYSCMEPTRLALEIGTHSRWVQQILEEAGHEVLVANARKLRMIYQNDSKNDRLDAEQLARLAPHHRGQS